MIHVEGYKEGGREMLEFAIPSGVSSVGWRTRKVDNEVSWQAALVFLAGAAVLSLATPKGCTLGYWDPF